MITCDHCRHFQHASSNPSAGMGRCMAAARHGFFYPMERHSCRDHDSVPDGTNGHGHQPRSTGQRGRPPGAE
jgi:hypothetical protein